jgi:hypothetical protein
MVDADLRPRAIDDCRAEIEGPEERLEAAIEMWDDALQLLRESLQRRFPGAAESELEAMTDEWLRRPDIAPDDPEFAPRHVLAER